MRKFIVNVNGNSYEVEVEEVGAAASAPVAPAAPQVTAAPKAAPAPAALVSGTAVKAPMPGNVLDIKVANGQTVKKCQRLGYMGNSGDSYGGHLHFEVWENGKRINPTNYLNKDLPKPTKINVTYQVYDNKLKKYWGEITNYNNNNSNGYAGCLGNPIGGIRAKVSDGTITIQSHIKGGQFSSISSNV